MAKFENKGLSTVEDRRMLVQLISDDVQKLWSEQGLRGSLLVSIALPIMLLILGNHRKHNPRTLVATSIQWCVYNSAYAVIPIALAITAQTTSDVSTRELMSFWASVLFVLLGGPDTFTAYSMEDNELWLRHSVLMASQALFTLYILLLSLPGCSHLPYLSILVYVAGLIKCFGRIQTLRLASTEHHRASMLGHPDPGPDYSKLMEEHDLKSSQGFIVNVDEFAKHEHYPSAINADQESGSMEIVEAHRLFKIFRPLFVDHILTYEDRDISTSYFSDRDSSKAFRAVEIELGLAYDELYTKAKVVCTNKGLIVRGASVVLILVVLVGFYFLSDIGNYQVVEVFITYIALSAEILKEVYALFTMVCSDWTDLWLNQHNRTRDTLFFQCLKQPNKQRWSNSIAQLDVLSVALNEKPTRVFRIQKLFGVDEYLEKQRYETYTEVSANLKDMIHSQFKEFVGIMAKNPNEKPLCVHRGSYSLQQYKCINLLWSTDGVDFDQSILIWHIATTLCYYLMVDDERGVNCIESNHISKYLLNLLVSNPEMMPKGIGMMRYRDTCADAKRFFNRKGPFTNKAEAYNILLQVNCNEVLPIVVTGDRSKTVLFDGCRLALVLREMKVELMWKVISQVWIEMLGYAAANCGGYHHSQQLGRGGQLLTHVWLLMAHLGLTEHFQVSKGHARAKLIVT